MRKVLLLGKLIVRERYWSALFLIYLVAWIIPLRWMKDFWIEHYTTLAAQPFILLGFGLTLWGRREQLALAWHEQNRSATYTRRPGTQGSLLILIIGCLLYFVAHFSRLAMVGILGLVLMLLGMIVRVYGATIIKAMLAPCCYLLCIVPWLPESGIARAGELWFRLYTSVATPILLHMGKVVTFTDQDLMVNGGRIFLHPSLQGAQGVIAAVVFFWGWGLYRSFPARRIVSEVLLGSSVAFLVHFARLMTVCFLVGSSSSLAAPLSHLNCWIFTLASFGLTLVLLRFLPRLKAPRWLPGLSQQAHKTSSAVQAPVDKVLGGSVAVGGLLGKGILLLFSPLTWVASQLWRGIAAGFGLLGKMNRGLEESFRKADRSRAQRRTKK